MADVGLHFFFKMVNNHLYCDILHRSYQMHLYLHLFGLFPFWTYLNVVYDNNRRLGSKVVAHRPFNFAIT